MTDDAAFATAVIVLRPSSFGMGAPRPRSALAVRFPGTPREREFILRGLLAGGWGLVAAPVGEFEPQDVPRCLVHLSEGHARVETSEHILYDGPVPLTGELSGTVWPELAHAMGEVLVFVTVSQTAILTTDDLEKAARAGHLVGMAGTLVNQ